MLSKKGFMRSAFMFWPGVRTSRWLFGLAAAVVILLAMIAGGRETMPNATAASPETVVAAPAAQFCNPNPISIPASGAASPYPSNITVSGLSGAITNVSLTLNSIQHSFSSDIDILLVGPGGQKFVLLSDVGGSTGFDVSATITLSDFGAIPIPSGPGQIASGTYKPANWTVPAGDIDTFASPAPGAPYSHAQSTGNATFASVFNTFDPNGVWSLYVIDDTGGDTGSIAGGWCLEIEAGAGQPGQVQFGSSSYNTNVGDTVSVTVNRTNGMTGAISVDFSAAGGTAVGGAACTSGVDFITPNTTLNFASGELSKTVNIQICLDPSSPDPIETATLTLSNPTGGATVGTPGTATLTISPIRLFCNATPIIMTGPLSSGPANPYPSNITVSGLSGVVSDVTITLTGIQHTWGRDIDVLLVSPDGRKFIAMSDPGQGNGFDNPVTITLSDAGATLITDQSGQILSGTYKPTNHNDALALLRLLRITARRLPGAQHSHPFLTAQSRTVRGVCM